MAAKQLYGAIKLTSKDTGKDIRDVTKNRQFTKAGINDIGIGGGSCRLSFEEVVKIRPAMGDVIVAQRLVSPVRPHIRPWFPKLLFIIARTTYH